MIFTSPVGWSLQQGHFGYPISGWNLLAGRNSPAQKAQNLQMRKVRPPQARACPAPGTLLRSQWPRNHTRELIAAFRTWRSRDAKARRTMSGRLRLVWQRLEHLADEAFLSLELISHPGIALATKLAGPARYRRFPTRPWNVCNNAFGR